MASSHDTPDLAGELHTLPFEGGPLADRVSDQYQDLLTDYDDVRNILILKRFPSGIEEFTERLADAVSTISRPNVMSVSRHASSVLSRGKPELETVSDEQRIEILARAIDQYDFTNDYYKRASQHDSFGRDVGRILLAATWQGGFEFTEETELSEYDEYLRELHSINQSFHDDFLRAGGTELIEKAAQIAEATEILRTADGPTRSETLEQTCEAILVVEFEEFGTIERDYLAEITRDVELVCVGEANSSIQRVWNEPGSVDVLASNLEPAEGGSANPDASSQMDAIAQYLATGSPPVSEHNEPIFTIKTETFEDQLREVANEIEYLRDQKEIAYDDVAVLFKDSKGPLQEARRILRRTGIPTASATVSGLGEDLAVRELYTLARHCIEPTQTTRQLLEARAEGLPDGIFSEIESISGLHDRLSTWIVRTDLKARVAREIESVDAFAQFQNVRKVLEIAEFVDETRFLAPTWPTFIQVLERAITFVTPDQYATDLEAEENGVAIDSVRVFKQDQRPIVFLINVIEGTYPADQELTSLFPTSWTKRMEHYPGVTTPSPDEVKETFTTAPEEIRDPYRTYYRELSRRQLAIGARLARDRLYFCSPDTGGAGLDDRNHASRFLTEMESMDAFNFIEVGSDDAPRAIHTQGRASREILREPWAELEAVRNAASTGKAVSIEDSKRRFSAIQTLLNDSEELDDRFELAVESQIDFALGEVSRDE